MSKIGSNVDFLRLSIPERIQLVGDIWDTIADSPEEVPVSDAQKAELDKRVEGYRADPEAGDSWDHVRKRIQRKK